MTIKEVFLTINKGYLCEGLSIWAELQMKIDCESESGHKFLNHITPWDLFGIWYVPDQGMGYTIPDQGMGYTIPDTLGWKS